MMNFAKWISFSFVIICIYILWQIKQMLLLALTALVLALTLNILVKKLIDLGLKRIYGILLSILTLFAIIILFFLILVPSLISQFQELFTLVPKGINKLILELDNFKYYISPDFSDSLPDLQEILVQLQPIFSNLYKKGFNFIFGFFGVLLSSLLLLALTLMILVDPLPYKQGFIRLFPSFYRTRINVILHQTKIQLEEWLADTFIKITSVIILTFLCLLILQVPLVSAQALLAGILAFIPYIGPTISVISPMAIAFLYSPWIPWLILIFYITIYQVTDKIIIPKLRQNRVVLIPANVIIGEVIFANFLGLLGLFLALPLIIISQILIKEILIKDIFDHWQIK
ncbi:AI-2E family transporter [Geminocystis sp. NIES-3708]|uniref:AI-2E family transporter n=1 Tax=Geminocystis sp. NIES-3708 TaxID=1615909 RepID=UPI000B06A00F|nr:AI-2E family transporter [Geminocystis sp. NIES-3708]